MIFTRGPSLPTSSSSSPTSLQVHRSSFCGGSYHYTLVVQLPPFIQVIRLQGHKKSKKSIIMIIKSIIRVWVHTLNFDGSVPLSHGWDFLFNWLTLRWDGGDDDLESDKLFNFSYDMMIGTTLVIPKITISIIYESFLDISPLLGKARSLPLAWTLRQGKSKSMSKTMRTLWGRKRRRLWRGRGRRTRCLISATPKWGSSLSWRWGCWADASRASPTPLCPQTSSLNRPMRCLLFQK